jgi:hypothetical protein
MLTEEGHLLLEKGHTAEAQLKFEAAFFHIHSTRCKEIKNHLYYNPRGRFTHHQEEEKPKTYEADKAFLVKMFEQFDAIQIKTIEVAFHNKDYYRVIILSKECLMEGRLELN